MIKLNRAFLLSYGKNLLCKTQLQVEGELAKEIETLNIIKNSNSNTVRLVFAEGVDDIVIVRWYFKGVQKRIGEKDIVKENFPYLYVDIGCTGADPEDSILYSSEDFEKSINDKEKKYSCIYEGDLKLIKNLASSKTPLEFAYSVKSVLDSGRAKIFLIEGEKDKFISTKLTREEVSLLLYRIDDPSKLSMEENAK